MEQMITVSIKGSNSDTNPTDSGSSVCTAE